MVTVTGVVELMKMSDCFVELVSAAEVAPSVVGVYWPGVDEYVVLGA